MSTMTPVANLEHQLQDLLLRVQSLERDVAQIKKTPTDDPPAKSDRARRWERIRGSMKDDPDFAEILRLGQEARKADFS